MLSVTFNSVAEATLFYDNLVIAKGPSLGTNFTLAYVLSACQSRLIARSPYTLLAHFTELPWAAEYGVEECLVRISVGLERPEVLTKTFTAALNAISQPLYLD